MKVSIVTQRQHAHQCLWLDAMEAGLERHGVHVALWNEGELVTGHTAVCWGWRIGQELRAQGFNVLVMERGFLGDIENRRKWASIGWNGLNGKADFVNQDSPPDRFDRHWRHLMQPWETDGDYILLMGQVAGDQAVADVDIVGWYRETAKQLSGYGWPVIFRAHPMAPMNAPDGTIGLTGGLSGALDGAALVVTYNSNSGVDAALAGVPVYALGGGSMAAPVAAESLALAPWRPDRTQWANDIAYTQWTLGEVAAGWAWAHLERFL